MSADILTLQPKNNKEPSDKDWQRDDQYPDLQLHVPTGIWYVRRKMKGKKPLFKSTREKNKKIALRVANNLIKDWMGVTASQFDGQDTLFRDYAPVALASWMKSDKYKSRTKENMQIYVGQLVDEIGYARLADITEVFIEDWINGFKKRSSRTTFRDYVMYTTKVLRHAKRNGILRYVPAFENPDPKKETGRCYTKAEMSLMLGMAEKMLSEARQSGNRQMIRRRLSTLIQLRCCFNGFMRLRECIQAPWNEVNLETGRWIIPAERIKTKKGKDIYVSPLILVSLRELRDMDGESEWLFPNPINKSEPIWDNKSAWNTLKKKAGITGRARWHDLRHTALTWALLGDDEFRAELEKLPPAEQEAMKEKHLMNPIVVASYAGTNIRTIESTYLKVKAHHTREVSTCIRL